MPRHNKRKTQKRQPTSSEKPTVQTVTPATTEPRTATTNAAAFPGYVSDINQLQAGDILLFRTNDGDANLSDAVTHFLIKSSSALLSYTKEGHYDTSHAAICIAGPNQENGQKTQIAHLTVNEHTSGYLTEPLQDMLVRDGGGDRAFLVFRPKDAAVGASIAETAISPDNKDVKWSANKLPSLYYTRAAQAHDRERSRDKKIAKESICSTFVVQVIKKGVRRLDEQYAGYDLDIRASGSLPKTLEGTLFQSDNYELLVYAGKENIYARFKQEIQKQMATNSRLKKLYDPIFQSLTTDLEANDTLNDLEKACVLLKVITTNELSGRFHQEHDALIHHCRTLGIFGRELEKAKLPESAHVALKDNSYQLK